MGFVKRKNCLKLKMLSGQVSPTNTNTSKALSHFKRFCEKVVGGKLVDLIHVTLCIKESEVVSGLEEYVDEFYNLVNNLRKTLKKPIEIAFENRLPGGWREVSSVTYDPYRDEYSVLASLYSEYGVQPQNVKYVRKETIEREERIPHLGVTIKAEGYVEQNPATDEFVGVGDAWIDIPRDVLKSASDLKKIFRKTINLADRVADEAQNELIITESEW